MKPIGASVAIRSDIVTRRHLHSEAAKRWRRNAGRHPVRRHLWSESELFWVPLLRKNRPGICA
jgi:hypothetical protein